MSSSYDFFNELLNRVENMQKDLNKIREQIKTKIQETK